MKMHFVFCFFVFADQAHVLVVYWFGARVTGIMKIHFVFWLIKFKCSQYTDLERVF